MSYYGGYYGAPVVITVTPPEEPGVPPVEAPIEAVPVQYVDHLEIALSRLPHYARAKARS